MTRSALRNRNIRNAYAYGSGPAGAVAVARIASTRGQAMNASSLVGGGGSNYTRFEARILCKAGPDGISSPKFHFNGFFYNVGQQNQPSNLQVELWIERNGVSTQVTFGGNLLGTIPAGATDYASDAMAGITIPPNAEYYQRVGFLVASGQQLMPGGNRDANIGETFVGSTAAVSQLGGTGALSIPAGGAIQSAAIMAAFVETTRIKTKNTALLLGDSLFSAASYDNVGDGHGNIGYIKPALYAGSGGPYPFADYSRSSSQAYLYATQTGWQAALDYCDVLLCNLGTNDLTQASGGNYTLAAIQANLLTIWAAAKAKGKKVYQALIWPRTTSTDSWATAANQTPLARFTVGGDKETLNTWILARVGTEIDGVIDLLSTVVDAGTPSVWKVTGAANYATADGTHPSATMWTLLQNAATAIVPNIMAAGALALTGNPPSGAIGIPYSFTPTVVNGTGPFTFQRTAGTLPAGLSLNPSTGAVAGTPTTANTYNFTLRVTDSLGAIADLACAVPIANALAVDTFTGSNGTNLTARPADTGQSWTAISGSVLIDGANAAYISANPSMYTLGVTLPSADYSVEAEVTFQSVVTNQAQYLIGRQVDNINNYNFGLRGSDRWALIRYVAGSLTELASVPYTPVAGQTSKLRMAFSGSNIRCYVNDVEVINLNDTSFAASGAVGIRNLSNVSGANTGLHFDNFKVYA
ncbi:putative Ig domain-containing protein [Sphingobium phenoxybenzoativorans]|uniref:Ig domain-containing protein n=1 Tax=Sphingobium phenoxybenzoativorans TaxID=1592790 RepID=A0A975K4U8_9SPHN|nr:putative Ig domain-containing protein [Sphingobium phenoxybenzoativorans]QUT04836.1 putative Ig domain-containing protein [Sphingobium phenoxybenzoativorans]